jgi:CheY-like chemotaxis protein
VTIRSIGHTVVGVADNLVRAVEAARKHQPDLALVDVQLKDGDTGIEVERIMRQSGIPCIFVTGFPEALLTGKAGEPAFVLTKPFDPHALAATISQVLAKSARSRESQTPVVPPPAARAKSAPRSSAARRKRAGVTEMQSSR